METAAVHIVISGIITAVASSLLVKRFCDPRSRLHWLDRPNERSLHRHPTPRTGGVGIMGGVASGWLVAGMPASLPFSLALLLAVVSVVDDAKGLPVSLRLASHLSAAAIYAWAGGWPPLLVVPVVLAIAWMTDLFNFMDGSDGFAGGMAMIGFGWYALAAGQAGIVGLAAMSFLIACASAAFLVFNFPPARIFMGDAGSIPLGFLAATLGVEGWRSGAWPFWFPVLVFSPFVVDATVTLLRRGLRGEKVWHAHREHSYQRLIRLGWSHRRLALAAYALMAAAGWSAWALCSHSAQQQGLGLGLWALIYLVLFLAVELRWRWNNGAES